MCSPWYSRSVTLSWFSWVQALLDPDPLRQTGSGFSSEVLRISIFYPFFRCFTAVCFVLLNILNVRPRPLGAAASTCSSDPRNPNILNQFVDFVDEISQSQRDQSVAAEQ